VNRKIVTFTYTISNDETGQLLAEGKTVHLTMGADRRSRALPQRYFDLLSRPPA
jgi:acyl-CoA thioesterase FadM